MKTKSKELDVDFIGGLGPLTKDEEKAISEFLKARKGTRDKGHNRLTKITSHRKKVHA
jgi:hypothetical protein